MCLTPFRVALLLAVALMCAGCTRQESPRANNAGDERIDVTVVDRTHYDAVLAELRGKVVLVDCWATWCLPCLEQLPHTGELAEQYKDRDFAAVTLSLDAPEKLVPVRRQLRNVGSEKVRHLISQFGGSSRSAEEFEVPGGALPHYKLYDRTGKLRRTFDLDPAADRQFTTDDVDAAVAALLAE